MIIIKNCFYGREIVERFFLAMAGLGAELRMVFLLGISGSVLSRLWTEENSRRDSVKKKSPVDHKVFLGSRFFSRMISLLQKIFEKNHPLSFFQNVGLSFSFLVNCQPVYCRINR